LDHDTDRHLFEQRGGERPLRVERCSDVADDFRRGPRADKVVEFLL
jgi:hypothetical protein